MENISSNAELKNAIQLLEAKRGFELELMKTHFHQAYENLNPTTIIENTLKEISASPYIVNNLISTSIGLAAGYVSKIAVTGGASNKFRKLLGVFLQFGITNIIARNPKAVKTFSEFISQHIHNKDS